MQSTRVQPFFVVPASFEIRTPTQFSGTQLGCDEKIADNAKSYGLAWRVYTIFSPIIGEMRRRLGNWNPNFERELSPIIKQIGSLPEKRLRDEDKQFIKGKIESSGEIHYYLIQHLYEYLSKQKEHAPWTKKKNSVLAQYKIIFNQLVSECGAQYYHLGWSAATNAIFEDLVEHVFEGDSLNDLFTTKGIGNSNFEKAKEAINRYLPKGANINTKMHCNPKFGSLMHYYIACEFSNPVKFIEFIDSKFDPKYPHTQFNYESLDSFGNTPLHIALLTRCEKAALKLLDLTKQGRKVGINIPDHKGRTPLMIAASLGMISIVKELLKQGADPTATDVEGHGLDYYAQLSEAETYELLSPIIHPHRCNSNDRVVDSQQSYLYCQDTENSLLCFYENNAKVKTGKDQEDHLVVLSTRSPHLEKIYRVVDCFIENIKQNNEWSKNQFFYVINQIIRIMDRQQMIALATALNKKLSDIKQLEAKRVILNAISSIAEYTKTNPIPNKPMLDLCLEGQKVVQLYLKSPEAETIIAQHQSRRTSSHVKQSIFAHSKPEEKATPIKNPFAIKHDNSIADYSQDQFGTGRKVEDSEGRVKITIKNEEFHYVYRK